LSLLYISLLLILLYGCASAPEGPPPTDAENLVDIDQLDPAWERNLIRVRHYTFGLPPNWTAEILQEDEQWLLLSLVGRSGESGILEFFSGPMGTGEETVRRYVGATVGGEGAVRSSLQVQELREQREREVALWQVPEGEASVRYVVSGALPGRLGGPSAAWLLQWREQGGESEVAPWPATTVASLGYDYRNGDIRIREELFTFYGGDAWGWVGDTPGGVVLRSLPPAPELVVILGAPQERLSSRLLSQGLDFSEPRWELETRFRDEAVTIPFLLLGSGDERYIHGRIEEGLHISLIPGDAPESEVDLEGVISEIAPLFEAHLFYEEGDS
jgi:hypothetical protein